MWEKYKHIIPHIAVGPGVINTVTDWAVSEGYRSLLVVCDPNTRRVAGDRVLAALRAAGITARECCFHLDEPVPDEQAIGFVTAAFSPDIELILGVGSGTINDICTFVGARVGRPSAIVGTAPSMDGYASLGSAMLLDGIKVTPPTQCPVAIFCDIDTLTAAPMLLTAAGLGDMLGKFTALADWSLAHILVGEPMPDNIVSLVKNALSKIVAGAPFIAKRDPAVIQSITEGLILSGIAMSLYGDSRPASGTEHHLSHFWEMRLISEGRKPALHGIKVGLATVVSLVLWKELAGSMNVTNLQLPVNASVSPPVTNTYAQNIRRLYGRTAESILQTENPNLPVELIEAHRQEIIDIANALPSPEEVSAMLSVAEAPVRPSEIGLNADTLRDSIIYARDRKKTYTLLQLLGDLGLLEDFSNRAIRYFEKTGLTGIKCFVLDMDGTIYLSDKVFPYSARFLKQLKKTGIDHVFYTNNSSQNSAYYIKKLKRMDIPITPDKLLMSTHVLLAFLKRHAPGQRVFVAGTKALMDDFTNAGYTLTDSDPDFTVLGFDTDMDYKRLTKLCDFIRSGIPVYGVNMDYNCPVEGGFIPDCGALASAVVTSTGILPEFFGKPSRRTLDYVIEKTGYLEEELCFIGDRLYTDIAITSGTKARSILVLSGETKKDDLQGSQFTPDLVVDDLEELMKII